MSLQFIIIDRKNNIVLVYIKLLDYVFLSETINLMTLYNASIKINSVVFYYVTALQKWIVGAKQSLGS